MELSVRERDRMAVLRQVDEGMLAAATGAARLGAARRHFRRLMRRFEAEGDGAAIHRLRGRRSNRALAPEVRERVLALAADPLQAGFGPPLLAEHARRRFGVRVSAETVRGWLAAVGVWKRRRKRAKHRSRRPQRAALGELVQWDSSIHPWLEARGPADLVAPADPLDAHRPLPPDADLEALFADGCAGRGTRLHGALEEHLLADWAGGGRGGRESGRARGSSSNGVSRASCACATAAGTWRPGRWVPLGLRRLAATGASSGVAR